MEIHFQTVKTPVGELAIYASQDHLLALCFENEKSFFNRPQAVLINKKNKITELVKEQLQNYFKDKNFKFSIPLKLDGTELQSAVWKSLVEIKPGKIRTYLEHAESVKNPKAVRAVSSAIGKNPIMIIVPCHRVIGTNKTLTGYAGGLDKKEWLLRHEGHELKANKII